MVGVYVSVCVSSVSCGCFFGRLVRFGWTIMYLFACVVWIQLGNDSSYDIDLDQYSMYTCVYIYIIFIVE